MSTKALSNRPTEEVVVKKCCASGARMDTKRNICTGINRVEFKYDVINTITNITQKSYQMKHFRHNYTFCQGKLISDENFKVTQDGILMNFTNIEIEKYVYNDFCVDVDFESGRSVFIVCENHIKIKKCCELNQILKKIDDQYHCVRSNKLEYLTDFNQIFGANDRLPNIEFITDDLSNLEEYKFKTISNGTVEEIIEKSSTCVDKLSNGECVLLDAEIHHKIIVVITWIISFLLITIIIPLSIFVICLCLGIHSITNCWRQYNTSVPDIINQGDEIELQSYVPPWKAGLKIALDPIIKNIYKINKTKRKSLEIDSAASTSKQEIEPLMNANLSKEEGKEDSPENDGISNSKLLSVAELRKIFEPKSKPKKTVDEDKIIEHLEDLMELTKTFKISEDSEDLEEFKKEKMVYAMQLLADIDEDSSRNYLEINRWDLKRAGFFWVIDCS